ncbi:hypothetical protein WICPIJ_004552 [Wickerhamomyces pijperi]|uniref:Calcineurin-like phosphoesterase domain-containing protein n=1 Tax=Wickerhamomyces pijperi TaxID=599730 RepID=A0A9P8Q5F5_WICPI|nr:hypothetical protein WICPIJ_004552 [Wickerhamomyces pijperi]
MSLLNKALRLSRRILLPLAVLIYLIFAFSNLHHTKNFYNNQIKYGSVSPYQGGLIDDVKIIKCQSLLYGECNQIIIKTDSDSDSDSKSDSVEKVWLKVDKSVDLNGTPSISEYIASQNIGISSLWDNLFSSVQHNQQREYLYVHLYQPESAGPGVIIDIAIGDQDSEDPPPYVRLGSQTRLGMPKSRLDIEASLKDWVRKDHGIWVKYGVESDELAVKDLTYFIGGDVDGGEDDYGMLEPRDGWRFTSGVFRDFNRVRLSIRQGQRSKLIESDTNHVTKNITIQNESDGFKILQVSDLHFSSNAGVCKDQSETDSYSDCKADKKTLQFIEKVLENETPDLVVITGDIINGIDNVEDYQTALLKALSPFITRKIPYAIALGLEDRHKYTPRQKIVQFIDSLPYSLLTGPDSNYAIHINNPQNKLLSTIYILDLYQQTPNQLELLRSHIPQDSVTKHSLLFQHIPIGKYRPKGTFGIVGQYNEKNKLSSSLTDSKTIQFIQDYQIKAISVGYEHTNDCCIQESDPDTSSPFWMCYSGVTGEAGYAKIDSNGQIMDRRVRMFKIDWIGSVITSWKRREADNGSEVFDYQYIYHELG